MEINLKNKNILVTGASRGIGKGLAIGLGKAGARIAVHYQNNRELAEQTALEIGNNSFAVQANLKNPEEIEKLFKEVVGKFGQLNVLVNNAGIFKMSLIESDSWLDDWNETLDVNLRAAALLSRLAILHFQPRGGGRIINISSRAAFRGDGPEHLAYAASKAGMVALSKSIARGFGKDNITSFLIAPVWVETDMSVESVEKYGKDFIIKDIALNKLTEPKDLAPMVALLAGGYADHATGTTIDMNAGSYLH
jgi:3-oxoacyl-[acyl-carrier protein] reductase